MAVPAKPNTLTLPYTGKEFLRWKAKDLVNTGERAGPA